MRTSSALYFILVISFILNTGCSKYKNSIKPFNEVNWNEIQFFPGVGRSQASAFWIEDKFYIGFGTGWINNYPTELNDFYEFNLSTNTWTRMADFPGIGRIGVTAFSIGSKGYIGFGKSLVNCDPVCTHLAYKDLWEYDPSSNSWEKIGTYDQIDEGETTYSRSYEVDGKVYITFGNELWVFDSSDNSIAKIGMLPEGLIFSTGFKINERIYIGTGGIFPLQTAFYEFNPATYTWAKKADFPGQARRSASGFALNNKGFISCGEGFIQLSPGTFQSIGLKDTWQYDPVSNEWSECKNYPGLGYIYQVSSNSDEIACVGSGERGPADFYQKDFWIVK